jgi:hypothetical protein
MNEKALKEMLGMHFDIVREARTHGLTARRDTLQAEYNGMIMMAALYEGVSEDAVRFTVATLIDNDDEGGRRK